MTKNDFKIKYCIDIKDTPDNYKFHFECLGGKYSGITDAEWGQGSNIESAFKEALKKAVSYGKKVGASQIKLDLLTGIGAFKGNNPLYKVPKSKIPASIRNFKQNLTAKK